MVERGSPRRVYLRNTYPTLFRTYITFGLISVGLGLNFLLTTPTFNPYHINKEVVGSVFAVLGITILLFLTVLHNVRPHLKILRFALAADIAAKVFWGIGASFTYFQGLTSLQLSVLYVGLATLEFYLLVESPVTVTRKPIE